MTRGAVLVWRACGVPLLALALLAAPGVRRAAAQGAPTPVAVSAPADSVLGAARLQFRIGRIDSASAILRQAVDTDSAATPARLELLGRCRVRAGDVASGLATFARLLDLAPEWTLDRRLVSDDERAVFERARLEWLQRHPEYRPPVVPRRVRGKPLLRQARVQIAAWLAACATVILLQQQHSGTSTATLPDLPGHP